MLKIIIVAIIALFLIIFLKNYRQEYSLVVAAVAGAIILVAVIKEIYTPFKELLDELDSYGVDSSLILYLIKALGICYITKFASELCEDFGQSSLAGKVEFAGRGAIFVLSLPIIKSILNLGLSLLG